MNQTARWLRCSKRHPCPVCGKSDWCCYLNTGEVFWCMRQSIDGTVPGFKAGRTHENGGTPWRPTIEPPLVSTCPSVHRKCTPIIEWSEIHARCMNALTPDMLDKVSNKLKVSRAALRSMQIGWSEHWSAYTFPMRNAVTEKIIGIRTRTIGGAKFSLSGSKQGYFMPEGQERTDIVFVCEGPTDCAALVGEGLEAIGRASCLHKSADLNERLRGRNVAIIADNDEMGMRGAVKLAAGLEFVARAIVMTPPRGIKDAREWISLGLDGGRLISSAMEALSAAEAITQIQRSTA